MERPRPAVVLACVALVVAGVPPAVGSGGPTGELRADRAPAGPAALPMAETPNTTSRLVLPGYRVTQREFETVHLDGSGTLGTAVDGVDEAHARRTIEREFEAADTRADQRSVIDGALRRLEDRAAALEARERAATRHYSDGNISAAELLRRLARIDAATREITDTLVVVRRLANRQGIERFDARIRDVGGHVEQLRGPVRHRAGRTMAGEAMPTRFYVVASDEGLVVSMLSGGQYIREATYWRNRNASALAELDQGDFFRRVEELYPWVTSQRSGETGFHWRGNDVWRFRATHQQGRLTAYVDAATGEVFREVQRLWVEEMPETLALERTGGGLHVVVERTYVGGPVRVVVEDAATGAAVNAAVTVDGHELGNTGADGVVWTIEPEPPYAVNVTHDGANVSVPVERPFLESKG